MPPKTVNRPGLPAGRVRALGALLAAVTLLAFPGPLARAQFESIPEDMSEDAIFSSYPTLDGIRQARRAGHPPERILAWIRDYDAYFSLDLDEALQFHAEGLETEIIASMARMPAEQVAALLGSLERVYVARSGPREGLSKRHILKMLEYGAPEEEVLAAIAENGSRAEVSLEEARGMMDEGASATLVVAIARGVVPSSALEARRAAREAPLLDDILAGEGEGEGEEPIDLGALFQEEGVEVEMEGEPRVTVLSDPPGARLAVASANIRPSDLLEMPRAAGRTPAELELPPGAYFILVEKPLGPFDEELIPALRTVHDGEGNTRTLIHEGTLIYDVMDCCTPRGLTGSLQITRIGRDQPGIVLGDEFGGMPPYLWDGNRYLLLDVREGRVERVLKVYQVTRAMGEERSVMATFIPSSLNPLEHPASMDSVSTRARTFWEVPSLSTLEGVARINGIPQTEVTRIHERLVETGKAVWKHETVDGVRILTLELDSFGRTRLHEVELLREGIFDTLATPGKSRPGEPGGEEAKEETAQARKEPKPMPAVIKTPDPDLELPILEVTNPRGQAALLRLGDGTILFVPPGESVRSTISPGSYSVEIRFDGEDGDLLAGITRFSYHARYSLELE